MRSVSPVGHSSKVQNRGLVALQPLGSITRAKLLSPFMGQSRGNFTAKRNKEDLQTLRELIEAGKVKP